MIKLKKVEIFEIDCMVIFELEREGLYSLNDIIKIQVDYLKNCPAEDRKKLINMFRDMGEETTKSDDELLIDLIEQVKEGYIYDYIIDGEEYIKNFQDVIEGEK